MIKENYNYTAQFTYSEPIARATFLQFSYRFQYKVIQFFAPFDTEFFKEKVRINNRHLNFFSDPDSKKNLSLIHICFGSL